MPAELSLQDLIDRYRKLDSDLVYDTLDAMGLPNQQLSLDLQPVDRDMVVAGEAFTCKIAVSEAGNKVKSDRLEQHSSRYQMYRDMYPGCVLVEDVGNDPVSGGLGENAGLTAKLHGCVGVVCDGGTRDRKALIRMDFPVFSRFSSCTYSAGRRRYLDHQIPVRLSGHLTRWVTVNPGDFVFGDCDGILVIPKALIQEVLEGAERVAEIEEEQRSKLLSGMDREEVYRVNRYAHIRRVVP